MGIMLSHSSWTFLVLLQCVLSYHVPYEMGISWSQSRTYRPVDYMVDITNNLGIDILYEHNFLNDNNIAFSPYGLTGILVALYEGVDGYSSLQIREAMKLPLNRDIMRIGFRDIHRRLRSYFIPKEGFLAGLAFNNENVTFRESYKKILQFYGYDFEMPKSTENNTETTTKQPSSAANTAVTANDEMTTTVTATASIMETTTTKDTTDMKETTQMMTTAPAETTTMMQTAETTTNPPEMSETIKEATAMTPAIETTTENKEEGSTSMKDDGSTMTNTEAESTVTTESSITSTITDESTNEVETSTTESTGNRRKRVLYEYDYLPAASDQFGFYRPVVLSNSNYEERGLHYQRSFLADGFRKVQITYMNYDTVLEYAYIPYLRSMALKLPLDTMEYYLLILLPEYEFGINQLIKDLKSERAPTLRQINNMLTNTYVQAFVPTFMLKGFVVLTTDLQKLGVCDPFEPKQDDFRPMTNDKNIYVRNIEQAITVTIRKYTEPNVKKRYVQNRPPVEFAATHPFLYFVMDSGIHVSLMAGKILNPLNSRIL